MHGRGLSHRHTVGCTDDLSSKSGSASGSHSPAPTSTGRIRKTGLLTVTERPPGSYHFELSKNIACTLDINIVVQYMNSIL